MKAESRGKFPGVKLHLDPDEVTGILAQSQLTTTHPLLVKMGKKIQTLLDETPYLLDDRSPEQVAAILVKEVEKASLQLKTLQSTGQFTKLNKETLKESLLKYVEDKK